MALWNESEDLWLTPAKENHVDSAISRDGNGCVHVPIFTPYIKFWIGKHKKKNYFSNSSLQ